MTPDSIDWLFGLAQFGIKFGLRNIRALVEELGHPERQFRSVHVAGTNGKGSVTAIVEAGLRSAGLRTGRYTSPHLIDLAERFAINGVQVPQVDMVASVDAARGAVERLRERGALDVHPTFFEVTTAVAFDLFRRHAVDVAVCEVGLGGRLDATNVLFPMVCGITSISFDHELYLGRALREIAAEKAGIIKPATPVVIGPLEPEAEAAIVTRAHECGADIIHAMDDVHVGKAVTVPDGRQRFRLRTPRHDYGEVDLALAGEHQVTNAVVAVRLLEQVDSLGVPVGVSAIVDGLASVAWPGRLQHVRLPGGGDVLLDAAHNPEGARALARYLSTLGAPRPLVFAAMQDKDSSAMLRALVPFVSRLVMTRASNPRSADPMTLAALARTLVPAMPVDVVDSPAGAVQNASDGGRDIVVAGSIFLLGDVMKHGGRS